MYLAGDNSHGVSLMQNIFKKKNVARQCHRIAENIRRAIYRQENEACKLDTCATYRQWMIQQANKNVLNVQKLKSGVLSIESSWLSAAITFFPPCRCTSPSHWWNVQAFIASSKIHTCAPNFGGWLNEAIATGSWATKKEMDQMKITSDKKEFNKRPHMNKVSLKL